MAWTQIESPAYWCAFVAAFLSAALWESQRPKRPLTVSAERRWSRHGILFVISAAVSVGILRVSPVAVAVATSDSHYGVLNQTWIPLPAKFLATLLLLDLVKYVTHRLYHRLPWLWKVHQVHHSDPDFDVSTAVRMHPIEVLVTQGSSLAAIAVVSPPAEAVLVAELLALFQSFFEHANASLPIRMERILRSVLITPDLHRIHHSEVVQEQNRNLGEIFPWWDRLFGTYTGNASREGDAFVVGLKGYQKPSSLKLSFMLTEPFQSEGG